MSGTGSRKISRLCCTLFTPRLFVQHSSRLPSPHPQVSTPEWFQTATATPPPVLNAPLALATPHMVPPSMTTLSPGSLCYCVVEDTSTTHGPCIHHLRASKQFRFWEDTAVLEDVDNLEASWRPSVILSGSELLYLANPQHHYTKALTSEVTIILT